MKTKRRNRKTSKLSPVRWTSYAIAAGATAAGTIATTEAEIHYSGPINYKFHAKSTFIEQTFPLSNGVFLIGAFNNVTFLNYHYAGVGVYGAPVSNSLRGRSVDFRDFLSALPGKSVVSHGPFLRNYCDRCYAVIENTSCGNSDWQDPGTYYVGFRFNAGAGSQYGWVRIRWSGCNRSNAFIVKDYAWGDPGDRIKTGQKQLHEDEKQIAPQADKSAAAAPPAASKGSLGLLAFGALGLVAWRKSRRAE